MSKLIAGLDEVGMGCLAGAVVVCVAAFEEGKPRIAGVRDSKSMSARQRDGVIARIVEESAFLNFGFATARTINDVGIAKAWQMAAAMALDGSPRFHTLIVDGTRAVEGYNGSQKCLPKADATCWQVSAASIVAKVIRDSDMVALSAYYPQYDWESNSGYGTKKHTAGLIEHGPTPIHRSHFIRKVLSR